MINMETTFDVFWGLAYSTRIASCHQNLLSPVVMDMHVQATFPKYLKQLFKIIRRAIVYGGRPRVVQQLYPATVLHKVPNIHNGQRECADNFRKFPPKLRSRTKKSARKRFVCLFLSLFCLNLKKKLLSFVFYYRKRE